MTQAITVGRHLVRCTPPLIVVESHGSLSPDEYDQIYDLVHSAIAKQQVTYLLMDIADTSIPSPAMRRRFGTRPLSRLPLRAIVTYGGSPILMAMAQLVRRGIDLVARVGRAAPFIVCRSEAEAQAWVAADRRHP